MTKLKVIQFFAERKMFYTRVMSWNEMQRWRSTAKTLKASRSLGSTFAVARWLNLHGKIFNEGEAIGRHLSQIADDLERGIGTIPDGSSLWLITSVINPSGDNLSYASTRSVFNSEERLRQTLTSIDSIRSVDPRATIVVFEGSNLTEVQANLLLRKKCFVFSPRHVHCFNLAIDSPYKGLGEAMAVIPFTDFAARRGRGFWKLSGRYEVDGIEPNILLGPNGPQGIRGHCTSTTMLSICYGVTAKEVRNFGHHLRKSLPKFLMNVSMEDLIFRHAVDNNIFLDSRLNCSGQVGPNGSRISSRQFTQILE